MNRILCCISALLLISAFTAKAQVYLQLEKAGTLKTTRYAIGDELTFRLKNDDKGWYTRPLIGMDVRKNKLIFPDVLIHLDSIAAIQLSKKSGAPQIIGTALQTGGVNMMLFAVFQEVFYDREREFDWGTLITGMVNIVVGTAVKRIFRYRVFRISSGKRLRVIDLNFSEPIGP